MIARVALLVVGSLVLGCASESETTGEFSCDAIVGEGYDIGQVSANWTLIDADGQPRSLYEFCGLPIYIEDTAAW